MLGSGRRRDWAVAVVADAVAVLLFVVIGRTNHHESTGAGGVWHTAWPFLVGAALGLALTAYTRTRPTSVPAGVRVWVWTFVIGMVLRSATGGGTAVAFVVVALVVLGVFQMGWRAAISGRRRRPWWPPRTH
jgi:Protein of unknown function (DUF3054)